MLKMAPERIARIELQPRQARLSLLRHRRPAWTTAGRRDIGPPEAGSAMALTDDAHLRPRPGDGGGLSSWDSRRRRSGSIRRSLLRLLDEAGEPVLVRPLRRAQPGGLSAIHAPRRRCAAFLMSRFVGEEWGEAMGAATAQ